MRKFLVIATAIAALMIGPSVHARDTGPPVEKKVDSPPKYFMHIAYDDCADQVNYPIGRFTESQGMYSVDMASMRDLYFRNASVNAYDQRDRDFLIRGPDGSDNRITLQLKMHDAFLRTDERTGPDTNYRPIAAQSITHQGKAAKIPKPPSNRPKVVKKE